MLDPRITTFLKVCETMNYTYAAEELHLTQPAVSKHIHALEDHYQVHLFSYHNKKLTLTAEGEYLKQVISAMNHDSMRVEETIQTIDRRIRLRMGATQSIGNYSLVQPLIQLMKSRPDLDISLTIEDTADLLEQLDNGLLDFILCEGNFRKTDYDYCRLRSCPLTVFCSTDYDVSGIRSFADLTDHTLILREKGSGTREIFELFLAEKGLSIRDFPNYHEINNPDLLVKLLESGMGISVLYDDVGREKVGLGTLRRIPLNDFHLSHDFHAIWKKGSFRGEQYRTYAETLLLEPPMPDYPVSDLYHI